MATVRESKARRKRARARSDALPGPAWARQLRALQRAHGAGRAKLTVEQLLAEDRKDRI